MESKLKLTSFGEVLRNLRETSELTLREVAAIVEIDPSLLAKIERNQRQPSKNLITNIANFFKIDEKELHLTILSDQIAYKIIDEDADVDILKVAEEKVAYIKNQRNE